MGLWNAIRKKESYERIYRTASGRDGRKECPVEVKPEWLAEGYKKHGLEVPGLCKMYSEPFIKGSGTCYDMSEADVKFRLRWSNPERGDLNMKLSYPLYGPSGFMTSIEGRMSIVFSGNRKTVDEANRAEGYAYREFVNDFINDPKTRFSADVIMPKRDLEELKEHITKQKAKKLGEELASAMNKADKSKAVQKEAPKAEKDRSTVRKNSKPSKRNGFEMDR